MANPLVAIVDDDPLVCRAVQRHLLSAGFAAETFESGERYISSGKPDRHACVVVDVQMPGMSGLALQSQLAAAGNRVPFVFITAHDVPGAEAQALAQGAVCVLRKPLSGDALLSAVTAAMDCSTRGR